MKTRMMWPIVASYLAGVATACLVAMLMPTTPDAAPGESPTTAPWQQAPTSPTTSPAAVSQGNTQDVAQHASAPLSAEARDRVAPLEARLAADPSDLLSRKQLALILLQHQQLMPAYEHASAILGTHPDDPDGLYVHGVVRLAMGHAPKAIELIDRVLASYPNHALALRTRAEAQRKIGDEGGAALTEARAREAARGGESEVDQLLAAASAGTLLEMMRSSSDATPPAGEAAAPAEDG